MQLTFFRIKTQITSKSTIGKQITEESMVGELSGEKGATPLTRTPRTRLGQGMK